jgi:hypothetical protein
MSGSVFYDRTEQPGQSVDIEIPDAPAPSEDIEMPDAPGKSLDIEMPDAPEDRNAVSFEDVINQFGRVRPLTPSAGQSSLYNSSDAESRNREQVPHGQDDPTSVMSNRGGFAVRSDDTRPTSVYPLGPEELHAFNGVRFAREHQCSPGLDGEHTIMLDTDEYECKFCKACGAYVRTADQDNVHWSTVHS